MINAFYPNFDVNQQKLDLWAEIMKDQEYEYVMSKTREYTLDNKFPPTVSDLVIKKRSKSRVQIEHEEMLRREGLLTD